MDGGHRWTIKMGKVGLRSAVRQGWLAAGAAEIRAVVGHAVHVVHPGQATSLNVQPTQSIGTGAWPWERRWPGSCMSLPCRHAAACSLLEQGMGTIGDAAVCWSKLACQALHTLPAVLTSHPVRGCDLPMAVLK